MKAKAREDKPSHISKGNVLDDLGFSPEEAAAIKLKASLHAEILRLLEKRKLKARQLEKIQDVFRRIGVTVGQRGNDIFVSIKMIYEIETFIDS